MIELTTFNTFLIGMACTAVIVFIALFKIDAGYGIMFSKKWGLSVNNKLGWVLMESPVFFTMLLCWYFSDRRMEIAPIVILLIFQTHYFQRSFIFPFLIKNASRMPISIMMMGVIFNVLNGLMQGLWIFHLSPVDQYTPEWLTTPQFIIGTAIFATGMIINLHSDHIIRHLRKPGDRNHYLPKGGMYNYVTSANYFGEFTEWVGFAILTWSWAGVVFALWTFANLAPRAHAIHEKYKVMFPEMKELKLKRIIPFIY